MDKRLYNNIIKDISKSLKKHINEDNLFDDDFFNQDDYQDDIEVADQLLKSYKIGDIYYKHKKPYAVCCGLGNDFKDNKPRFCLLSFKYDYKSRSKWCKENNFAEELGYHEYEYYNKENDTYLDYIDENGYENTQIIKTRFLYPLNIFPAFQELMQRRQGFLPHIPLSRLWGS